jgi:hypothetical protein
VAFWPAGQASVTSVSAHTPDMCLVGSGWEPLVGPQGPARLTLGGRELPDAQERVLSMNRERLNLWFWHLYGGRSVGDIDMHSPLALIRETLAHGIRRDRSQVFLRISSNAPWSQVAQGALLPAVFERLRPLGF